MSYIQGFVIPVPTANKDAYLAMATKAAPVFVEYGAIRVVETWGDAVPDGEVTDFWGAVQATEDETVVFSWIEWPDRETYVAAGSKIMEDPRMQPDGPMPFDGKRMIYAGFAPLLDTAAPAPTTSIPPATDAA